MTDPILRVPLSEAEAHRKQLADARARIAVLERSVLNLCDALDEARKDQAAFEALRITIVGALTNAGEFLPVDEDPVTPTIVRVRIASLKARAEKAERERDETRAFCDQAEKRFREVASLTSRAEAAERQVAALRDALTEAEDAVEMVIVGIEANHPRYWSSAAAYAEAMEACRTASIPRLAAIRAALADTAKAAEGWFSEAEVCHAADSVCGTTVVADYNVKSKTDRILAALRSARGGK